jgi:hypothetical protein
VGDWVKDYRKHPAGWAALLMIHGIPEVSGRLRLKVQNYAVFSALFLGGSIKAMSGSLPVCSSASMEEWECAIRKRVYTYSFAITIASHILCIFLAMAFHNALNEAARDSDVFRIFARGKGFRATARCQAMFRIGAISSCVSLVTAAQESTGWDFVVFAAILFGLAVSTYRGTSALLFSSGSIVDYWREELGGKPDADDPYDLTVPLELFSARADNDALSGQCQDADAGSEYSMQEDDHRRTSMVTSVTSGRTSMINDAA